MDEVKTDTAVMATKVRYENLRKNDNNSQELVKNDDDKVPDKAGDSINLTNIRVTEMKTCGRLYPPKPGSREEEIKIEVMKDIIVNKAKEYIHSNSNHKTRRRFTNITESQERGLLKLRKRVDSGQIVIQ